jgi:AcrR family transcriptional regulator
MPRPPTSPAGLGRDRIELEALALIEELGLEAFSLRKLAARLGCEPMSLYHHVPGKPALLDALVDRLLGGLPRPPSTDAPAARLRAFAAAWRQLAREHPQFYLWLALHRWNSATGVALLGEVLTCFHAAGLAPEAAARAFRAWGYYVLGATLDETRGYGAGPSSLHPLTLAELEHAHPRVAAAGAWFQPAQFDTTFELGLAVLLRGLGVEAGEG